MPRGKRSVKRSETSSLNEPNTQDIANDVFIKSKKWNVGYVPLIPEFCREPGCECHVQNDSSQKLNQGHLTPSTTTAGSGPAGDGPRHHPSDDGVDLAKGEVKEFNNLADEKEVRDVLIEDDLNKESSVGGKLFSTFVFFAVIERLIAPIRFVLRALYLVRIYFMIRYCPALLGSEHAYTVGGFNPAYETGGMFDLTDEEEEDEVEQDHSGYYLRRRVKRSVNAFGGQGGLESKVESSNFGPKHCPKAGAKTPWLVIEKAYENWLKQTEIPAATVMYHIKQRGWGDHHALQEHIKNYEREFPNAFALEPPQAEFFVCRRTHETPGLQTVNIKHLHGLMREESRIPAGESPQQKQEREQQEGVEDRDRREQHILSEFTRISVNRAHYEVTSEFKTAPRTGDIDKDFPNWKKFKDWMRERVRHTKPMPKIKRLIRWLRRTRKRGESFDDFIEGWLNEAKEIEDDAMFWEPFETNEFMRTIILLINLDLPTGVAVDLFKEMSIDGKDMEKMKKDMTVENLRNKIEMRVVTPQDYSRRGPDAIKVPLQAKLSSGFGNYVSGVETPGLNAHGMYPAAASYMAMPAPAPWAANQGFYSGGTYPGPPPTADALPAQPVFAATTEHPELDPELITDHDAGPELGNLTDGEFMIQHDHRPNRPCACFCSDRKNEVVFYDVEAHAYLLKNQCAACGGIGHFWKDCTNGEKQFPGKPNKPPRNLINKAKRRNQSHFAECAALFIQKKKRRFKGGGGGKGKGFGGKPKKGKGYEAEEVKEVFSDDEEDEEEGEEGEDWEWDSFWLEVPVEAAYKGGGKGRTVKKKFWRKRRIKGRKRQKAHFNEEQNTSYSTFAGHPTGYENTSTVAYNSNPGFNSSAMQTYSNVTGWQTGYTVEEVDELPAHMLEYHAVKLCIRCKEEALPGKKYCVCADSIRLKTHYPNEFAREVWRNAMIIENSNSVAAHATKVLDELRGEPGPKETWNKYWAETMREEIQTMREELRIAQNEELDNLASIGITDLGDECREHDEYPPASGSAAAVQQPVPATSDGQESAVEQVPIIVQAGTLVLYDGTEVEISKVECMTLKGVKRRWRVHFEREDHTLSSVEHKALKEALREARESFPYYVWMYLGTGISIPQVRRDLHDHNPFPDLTLPTFYDFESYKRFTSDGCPIELSILYEDWNVPIEQRTYPRKAVYFRLLFRKGRNKKFVEWCTKDFETALEDVHEYHPNITSQLRDCRKHIAKIFGDSAENRREASLLREPTYPTLTEEDAPAPYTAEEMSEKRTHFAQELQQIHGGVDATSSDGQHHQRFDEMLANTRKWVSRSAGEKAEGITVANDGKDSEQFEDDDFKSIDDSPEKPSDVMWKRVEAPVGDLDFEKNFAKNLKKKKKQTPKTAFSDPIEDLEAKLSEALATDSIRQGKSPSDWQLYEPRAGPVVDESDTVSVSDLPLSEERKPSGAEDSLFNMIGGPVPNTSLRKAVVLYQKPSGNYRWGQKPPIGSTYNQELDHNDPLPELTVGLKIPNTYPYYPRELLDTLDSSVEHIDSRVPPTAYYQVPPHRVHEFLIPKGCGNQTKKRLMLVYGERLKKKVLEELPSSDRETVDADAAPTPPRPPSRVQ